MGSIGGAKMSEVTVEHNIDNWQRALDLLPQDVRQRAMKQAAQTAGREMLRRFRRTTGSWRHKPHFEVLQESTPSSVTVMAGTDDPIYRFVDQGTRPHTIEPIGQGYPLRFQEGYRAKTMPGVLGSSQGGPTGATVRAMRVRHPGTKPRGFTQMIFKEVRSLTVDLLVKLVHNQMVKRARWAARR